MLTSQLCVWAGVSIRRRREKEKGGTYGSSSTCPSDNRNHGPSGEGDNAARPLEEGDAVGADEEVLLGAQEVDAFGVEVDAFGAEEDASGVAEGNAPDASLYLFSV